MHDSILNIGPRLRELRRKQKRSQGELAEMCALTKGMISKLETGRSIPTLPVLFRVLAALDCEAEDFFRGIQQDQQPKYIHAKSATASPMEREIQARGFNYLTLLEGGGGDFQIRAAILEIEPGSIREKVTTDAFEYKYMLSGKVDYEIGDDVIQLEAGDSLFYDGRIEHVPHNRGEETARMLIVYLHDKILGIS